MKNFYIYGHPNCNLTNNIKNIAKNYSTKTGEIYCHEFPSGEHYCQIKDNIRGKKVFIIQPTHLGANNNILFATTLVDAARRASAKEIILFIPYFYYARQDRKDKPRVPISAKMVLNLYEASGVTRIVGVDIHCLQLQGFTNLPFDHLTVFDPDRLKSLVNDNTILVSPDAGGIKRCSQLAEHMCLPFAYVSKKRISDTEVKSGKIVGDSVNGKDAFIIDDLTESVSTLIECAKTLENEGAISQSAFVAHGALTANGLNNLKNYPKLKLYSTNTVLNPLPMNLDYSYDFFIALKNIKKNKSLSNLFKIQGF